MSQTPHEYSTDQQLSEYNRFNDMVAAILQHDAIRKGFIPSKKQAELFTLALYDIDRFRQMIIENKLEVEGAGKINLDSDEQLLELAIGYIDKQLYSQFQ